MPGASVLQDFRYGTRLLRRSPIFAAVAVLSIAGALTAGTAVFAFMNAVMYRPIGVGDGDNLYRIFTSDWSGGSLYNSSSYPDYEAFRATKGVLSSTCATEGIRANLVVGGAPQMHEGEIVSPGCFAALKLTPHRGRFFSEDQMTPTGDPIPIVISHSLWTRRFAGDPAIIGKTLLLNGMSVAVTAVGPRRFAGTSLDAGADFWAPIDIAPVVLPPGVLTERRQRMWTIFARLANGVDRKRAEAGLAVVASQLRQLDDRAWADTTGATRKVAVLRETDARFAGAPEGKIGIVAGALAAVAVIIAIACLNLATMLLARGAARSREMAIRLAIGASRARVLRQLATESLMIAALGAGIAIASLWVGLRVFEAFRPAILPAFDVALDWRVLTFGVGLAVAAALLFGLAPAAHTLRLAMAEGLKGRVAAAGARWIRLGARETLIVVQVAVSVALLLVSTLFLRAMSAGATLSPGFSSDGVSVVTAHLDAVPDKDAATITAAVLQAAEQVRDVQRVSLARVVPLSGANIAIYASGGDRARAFYGNVVSPGYFATLEIPMRAGRDFDRRDALGGAPVVIVNETLARTLWGTTNAVGRTLLKDSIPMQVIGIVADIKYRAFSEEFRPLIYLPIAQWPGPRFILQARVRGGGETLAALDGAIRSVDRRVAIEAAMPMRSHIERAMIAERAAQWGGGAMGIVQLVLAVMALWGLVAYAVERRTTELGIRLALGATPSSLVRLTIRPAGVSIVIGVALGSVLGAVMAKVVQSESVGLAPLDMMAVLPVAAVFTVVAMMSAWWPARRAGMADPAISLRRD